MRKSTVSTANLLEMERRRLKVQHNFLVYEAAQLSTFGDVNAAKRDREEIVGELSAC